MNDRASSTARGPAPERGGAPEPAGTRDRLVRAAAAEFNERGFAGTDSNRIARRAGFAPQTFYRWFKDKTAIFIAVYESWERSERATLEHLIAQRAPAERLVEAALGHHREFRVFRRALRALAIEDPAVRAARAESRRRQIAQIKRWAGRADLDDGDVAAALLQSERLADALVEGEIADLGLSEDGARRALASIIRRLIAP
jgi:AcrR family transcriptional regulator